MIEKALELPTYRRRCIRRKLSLFHEETYKILAYGMHFLQRDGEISPSEGVKEHGVSNALLMSEGHDAVRFDYADALLTSEYGDLFPFAQVPAAVFCFVAKDGERKYYALTKEGCFELSLAHATKICEGGSVGAVHGERLYLAEGDRLRWTAPLDLSAKEEETQGAGHVDLPSADGAILAAISLGEKLYLFRERGIVRFGGKGDTLSFYADHVPFSGGTIRAGSVRKCGDKVCFLTENGVYAFDGRSAERLVGCGFSRLDLSRVMTASCGGSYYAAARFEGEDCLWCVEEGRGHLIRVRADGLAGGKELYFSSKGKLYSLEGKRALGECVLKTEYSLLGLSSRQKFLDGILIEGRGHFRVEAKGERGLPRSVSGPAGVKLRFPLPVRGNGFTFDIRTLDDDAKIDALGFDLREEVTKW